MTTITILDDWEREKGYVTDAGKIYRYSAGDDVYVGYVDASGYIYESTWPGHEGAGHTCVGHVGNSGNIFQHKSNGQHADYFQVGSMRSGLGVLQIKCLPNYSQHRFTYDEGEVEGEARYGEESRRRTGGGALLLLSLSDVSRPSS